MGLVVMKFGGSSLAVASQIQFAAKRVADQVASGNKVIVVVSAMGKTTDELTALAYLVSAQPNRRELDMLLSTGERISMSLFSMALHDLGIKAISFTGSQAGVLTTGAHSNALILDIKATRVEQELHAGKVIVLAGFQGVDPIQKEITTLGRGGSDSTAVAMSACFSANRCEILKDVDGVLSADPKIINSPRALRFLTYDSLLDMTFWGAKVLHYRSVELAKTTNVPLYIGLTNDKNAEGTHVIKEVKSMYEQNKILSVNSHDQILTVILKTDNLSTSLNHLQQLLTTQGLPWPQILSSQVVGLTTRFYLAGPQELLSSIHQACHKNANVEESHLKYATVTATCVGAVNSSLPQKCIEAIDKKGISCRDMLMSPMSMTIIIPKEQRIESIQTLHSLEL